MYLSDRYVIKKRLEPYAKSHIDEYNRYMEKEKKFASWNTLEYAGFSSILITVFIIIITDN